jgi:hypothetical protein
MAEEIVKGRLITEGGKTFVLGTHGRQYLKSERFWKGYTAHWLGQKVCARHLPQIDYETGKPMIMVWPDDEPPERPQVVLYYNERLRKYPTSLLGHIAINVKGEVFNFSHLTNENEVVTPEEYLYRPALGEFAPHPVLGRYHVDENGKAYYDKFGRLFMRSVHVLEVEGLPADRLSRYYHNELACILNTPCNPRNPEEYPDFNLFTRNCTTIIRDGLREAGFPMIRGIFPRDLFVSAAHHLLKGERAASLKTRLFKMKQLEVPEAPESGVPWPVNPINLLRLRRLSPDYP